MWIGLWSVSYCRGLKNAGKGEGDQLRKEPAPCALPHLALALYGVEDGPRGPPRPAPRPGLVRHPWMSSSNLGSGSKPSAASFTLWQPPPPAQAAAGLADAGACGGAGVAKHRQSRHWTEQRHNQCGLSQGGHFQCALLCRRPLRGLHTWHRRPIKKRNWGPGMSHAPRGSACPSPGCSEAIATNRRLTDRKPLSMIHSAGHSAPRQRAKDPYALRQRLCLQAALCNPLVLPGPPSRASHATMCWEGGAQR
jgi:hypothetical protein